MKMNESNNPAGEVSPLEFNPQDGMWDAVLDAVFSEDGRIVCARTGEVIAEPWGDA
jgi:hypothetical protein